MHACIWYTMFTAVLRDQKLHNWLRNAQIHYIVFIWPGGSIIREPSSSYQKLAEQKQIASLKHSSISIWYDTINWSSIYFLTLDCIYKFMWNVCFQALTHCMRQGKVVDMTALSVQHSGIGVALVEVAGLKLDHAWKDSPKSWVSQQNP